MTAQTPAPVETLHAPQSTNAAAAPASPEVLIRQFEPRDPRQVEELFAAGVMYYAHDYPDLLAPWQVYVNESIAGDIATIQDVYIASGGNFWVATVDGKVVAMVALEKKSDGDGELRRMSVHAEYCRFGLGRTLVVHLEHWAKANEYAQVWLSTGAVMTTACKFYSSIGYTHTKTGVASEDPYVEALYFAKQL